MCKEFSGPSSCCFSCSHKLCCSGRGGALICSQILWGSICAGWRCREQGGYVKYIPKPQQPRWGYFREGSGWSSLAGRRVFARPLVMAPSCDSQELRVGHIPDPGSVKELRHGQPLWRVEKLPWWRSPGPRWQQWSSSILQQLHMMQFVLRPQCLPAADRAVLSKCALAHPKHIYPPSPTVCLRVGTATLKSVSDAHEFSRSLSNWDFFSESLNLWGV